MKEMKFAFCGAGFWADCQLSAWQEIKGVKCVAIFNRTVEKAEKLSAKFNIPNVYDKAEDLLKNEQIDFIDIATSNDSHEYLVLLAAKYKVPVICQKPMAPTQDACRRMMEACTNAKIPFLIHENYRWQAPIRALKNILNEEAIGKIFRIRLDAVSGFPDITMQPFLGELEQYIIADLGVHILDICRFLMSEANSMYCITQQVHQNIKGEDVATMILTMKNGAVANINLALAENYIEKECFPQTLIFVEGDKGSIEVAPDYWIRVTTKSGTLSRRFPPQNYAWADKEYLVSHAAIVPCHQNLIDGLRGIVATETTAEDNIKTLQLAFAAYHSAKTDKVIYL